jgi:hypothetical protein
MVVVDGDPNRFITVLISRMLLQSRGGHTVHVRRRDRSANIVRINDTLTKTSPAPFDV